MILVRLSGRRLRGWLASHNRLSEKARILQKQPNISNLGNIFSSVIGCLLIEVVPPLYSTREVPGTFRLPSSMDEFDEDQHKTQNT
jgi:hypothetical protein